MLIYCTYPTICLKSSFFFSISCLQRDNTLSSNMINERNNLVTEILQWLTILKYLN